MTTLNAISTASAVEGPVEKLLTELGAYVKRQQSKLIKTEPLIAAIKQWQAALSDNPAALRVLIDTNTIPAMVAVRRPAGSGLLFFVPVVGAWLLLMVVEIFYSLSGSKESFFYWWSTQPYGPYVYSGAIGISLIAVLAIQRAQQVKQQDADAIENELEIFGVKLAVAVAALPTQPIDDPGRLSLAAGSLTAAGDRLTHAADSMRFDKTSLDRAVEAAARAERATGTLDAATQALATQVVALTTALEKLPGVVAETEARLAPVQAVANELASAGVQAQRQSQDIKTSLERLATEILPLATRLGADATVAATEANKSMPRVVKLAETLNSALTAIKENQQLSGQLLAMATRLHALLDEGIDSPNA